MFYVTPSNTLCSSLAAAGTEARNNAKGTQFEKKKKIVWSVGKLNKKKHSNDFYHRSAAQKTTKVSFVPLLRKIFEHWIRKKGEICRNVGKCSFVRLSMLRTGALRTFLLRDTTNVLPFLGE